MNIFNNKKGQSLVEAIGAVAIILTGIVVVVAMLIYAINAAQIASLKNQAHFLAVEGIELTRYLRDNNFLEIEGGEITGTPFVDVGAYFGEDRYNIPRIQPEAAAQDERYFNSFFLNSQETCSDHPCRQIIDTTPFYTNENGLLESGESGTLFNRWTILYEICEGNVIMDTVGQECSDLSLFTIGVKVESHVEFTKGPNTHDYVLEEEIYNWKYDY
ncbi:hypothetical protein KKC88_05695 [Patescibacteria group bacterium]|nr:hypothetical protein [Patescibacteria group bacterium]MBU1673615.1 hypothetical protein [Patescibacteria group bacterium]MBU1963897.1 hypothetical protein [Patescibacteria group bacterium]